MGDAGDQPELAGSDDVLKKIAGTGPVCARASALLILVLSAVTPYWQQLFKYVDERQLDQIMRSTTSATQGVQPYVGGTPVAAPKDAGKLVSDTLDPSDATHLSWHTVTLEEHPAFNRILVAERKGILAYSVYPSDGCILIKHIIRGHIKTDLVRAEVSSADASRDESLDPLDFGQSKINVDWEPQGLPSGVDTSGGPNKTQVQAGCLNPHPGQFQYWVGSQSGCLQQIFRKFADGCTHYQMHNSCNNTWDPQIHWTFCSAQHRW